MKSHRFFLFFTVFFYLKLEVGWKLLNRSAQLTYTPFSHCVFTAVSELQFEWLIFKNSHLAILTARMIQHQLTSVAFGTAFAFHNISITGTPHSTSPFLLFLHFFSFSTTPSPLSRTRHVSSVDGTLIIKFFFLLFISLSPFWTVENNMYASRSTFQAPKSFFFSLIRVLFAFPF